jgi:hypothetical protein
VISGSASVDGIYPSLPSSLLSVGGAVIPYFQVTLNVNSYLFVIGLVFDETKIVIGGP